LARIRCFSAVSQLKTTDSQTTIRSRQLGDLREPIALPDRLVRESCSRGLGPFRVAFVPELVSALGAAALKPVSGGRIDPERGDTGRPLAGLFERHLLRVDLERPVRRTGTDVRWRA
jgi:hypothetical protein